jgi:hypothetical protein
MLIKKMKIWNCEKKQIKRAENPYEWSFSRLTKMIRVEPHYLIYRGNYPDLSWTFYRNATIIGKKNRVTKMGPKRYPSVPKRTNSLLEKNGQKRATTRSNIGVIAL